MNGNQSLSRLLSIDEVAERLSISVRSVRTLIERGALPTVRVTERRVAVDEVDVAAYVAARRERSTRTSAPSSVARDRAHD